MSGYLSGGGNAGGDSNVIEKFPFASDSNATDTGDLNQGRYALNICLLSRRRSLVIGLFWYRLL